MNDDFFSAEEAADRLGLHPRTVRRYIREGRLKARKIGREWRIPGADIRALLGLAEPQHAEHPAPESEKALPGEIRVRASVIVDVQDEDDSLRLSRIVLAALNAKSSEFGEVRYDHIFYKNERKARFVIWGDPAFIGNLLILFSKISG